MSKFCRYWKNYFLKHFPKIIILYKKEGGIIQEITKESKYYPKRLLEIKQAPKKLYVEGDISLLSKNSIAIVGARKCTKYGAKYAAKFAKELARADICIISGLANGIDAIAHTYSKSEIGKTIAVLGSGLNYIYPRENLILYNEILEEGGCVISEYEPNQKSDLSKFPMRNRIISGLSLGVLLIEARYRSGSNITARYAFEQRKSVFCIPHNIESKTGYGPNEHIKNGAKLVTNYMDILEEYNLFNKEEKTKIDEKYIGIYKCINEVPRSINEISRLSNKTISEVNEALFMLEMEGLIKSLPGNEYIVNLD